MEPKPIPVIVLGGETEEPSLLASPLVPLAAAAGGAVLVFGLGGLGVALLSRRKRDGGVAPEGAQEA